MKIPLIKQYYAGCQILIAFPILFAIVFIPVIASAHPLGIVGSESDGGISKFDGTTWTFLTNMSGNSWAGGYGEYEYITFKTTNAGVWEYDNTTGTFTQMTSMPADRIFALDNDSIWVSKYNFPWSPTIVYYNGSTWTVQTVVADSEHGIANIRALSDTCAYATLYDGSLRWDGGVWTMDTTHQNGYGLWAVDSENVYEGTGQDVLKWNGSSWSVETGPFDDTVTDIYFNRAGTVGYALLYDETASRILKCESGTWSLSTTLTGEAFRLTGYGRDIVYASSLLSGGAVVYTHDGGTTWTMKTDLQDCNIDVYALWVNQNTCDERIFATAKEITDVIPGDDYTGDASGGLWFLRSSATSGNFYEDAHNWGNYDIGGDSWSQTTTLEDSEIVRLCLAWGGGWCNLPDGAYFKVVNDVDTYYITFPELWYGDDDIVLLSFDELQTEPVGPELPGILTLSEEVSDWSIFSDTNLCYRISVPSPTPTPTCSPSPSPTPSPTPSPSPSPTPSPTPPFCQTPLMGGEVDNIIVPPEWEDADTAVIIASAGDLDWPATLDGIMAFYYDFFTWWYDYPIGSERIAIVYYNSDSAENNWTILDGTYFDVIIDSVEHRFWTAETTIGVGESVICYSDINDNLYLDNELCELWKGVPSPTPTSTPTTPTPTPTPEPPPTPVPVPTAPAEPFNPIVIILKDKYRAESSMTANGRFQYIDILIEDRYKAILLTD